MHYKQTIKKNKVQNLSVPLEHLVHGKQGWNLHFHGAQVCACTRPGSTQAYIKEPLQKAEVPAMQGRIAIFQLPKQLENVEKRKSHFLFSRSDKFRMDLSRASIKWRSLGESNPCLRRERATSWATRRRERMWTMIITGTCFPRCAVPALLESRVGPGRPRPDHEKILKLSD